MFVDLTEDTELHLRIHIMFTGESLRLGV